MSDRENDTVMPQIGERRTYQMMVEQIESKLSSKSDWYQFLEQHLYVQTCFDLLIFWP